MVMLIVSGTEGLSRVFPHRVLESGSRFGLRSQYRDGERAPAGRASHRMANSCTVCRRPL